MNSEDSPAAPHVSPFEVIRRESEDGSEYWSARDLARILNYTEYSKFRNAIQKAEEACQNSGEAVSDHFAHVGGMIETGKGAKQKVRQTIEELGGTMPEDLLTPKESIQQLQQKEQKRLKQGLQLSMFDEPADSGESDTL
jgi:vacuolar-type H+-ATPase subunit I/STV1